MSPDPSETTPSLLPEDIALEASLPSFLPRPPRPGFLDHLLYQLEIADSDDSAPSSPHSPPMPLDASLLAFESELRTLRPLDVDFPTGQRVLQALEREWKPAAPALSVVDDAHSPAPAAAPRSRWAAARPWAAAAALVAASWIALPHLPRSGTPPVTASSGLIPYASGDKATVTLVFPANPRVKLFGSPGSQNVDSQGERIRPLAIPEASAPSASLGIDPFDIPEEYCQKVGINHGVGILRLEAGSPAGTQGLEVGDIVIRFNGAPVTSAEEFSAMIRNSAPGSIATLKILRGRLIGDIPIRLGSKPSA